jgi:hypothetical protein
MEDMLLSDSEVRCDNERDDHAGAAAGGRLIGATYESINVMANY